jgi:hypothetical protein
MADTDEKKSLDPALTGVDRLRDTAKWLIGAYAGVGTALVVGLQLTSLGKVEEDSRLVIAIVAAATALVAVLYGIWKVTDVLAPAMVEPSDLGPGSLVDRRVRATPTLLKAQASDLATLQAAYAEALSDYQEKRRAAREDPGLQQAASKAFRELMALHDPLDHLRAIALFEKVQALFSDAKRSLGKAGIVITLCVIAFAWAANPSDEDQAAAKAGESGPTLLNPSAAMLSIERERKSLATLREKLGKGCNLEQVPALVVGGTAEEPEVITLPQAHCKALRFTISDDIGVILGTKSAVVAASK